MKTVITAANGRNAKNRKCIYNHPLALRTQELNGSTLGDTQIARATFNETSDVAFDHLDPEPIGILEEEHTNRVRQFREGIDLRGTPTLRRRLGM